MISAPTQCYPNNRINIYMIELISIYLELRTIK